MIRLIAALVITAWEDLRMPWTDLLRTLILALIALAYTAIKYAYPDFPLGEESFTVLIVWIVCAFGGGAIFGRIRAYRKLYK